MSALLVSLCLVMSWTQVEAQPVLALSLDQAVEMALAKNPTLLALEKEIDSSRARTRIEASLPETEVSLELAGLNLVRPRSSGEKELSFWINQSVPFPGKLRFRTELGQTYEEEARLHLERQKILVATQVKKTYFRSLFHQTSVALLEKSLTLLQDIQKNALSRYALGAVPYREVLRVRLEEARTRNDLLEARKELATALGELNLLLGQEKDQPLVLTSALENRLRDLKPEELTATLKLRSPSLKLAHLLQKRASLLGQIAELDRLPDFSFGFSTPSKRFGAIGFGFGLSYPLFSRKKLQGTRNLAEAEKQKAVLAARAAERFYETRQKQVWEEIMTTEKQLRIFEEALLQETEAELEKARHDFSLGQLDSLGLLDLYRNSTLVRLEYLRALYLYNCALADLEKAGEDYE